MITDRQGRVSGCTKTLQRTAQGKLNQLLFTTLGCLGIWQAAAPSQSSPEGGSTGVQAVHSIPARKNFWAQIATQSRNKRDFVWLLRSTRFWWVSVGLRDAIQVPLHLFMTLSGLGEKEAWGSEDEQAEETLGRQQQRRLPEPRALSSRPEAQASSHTIPSLQTLCLDILGEFLDELLEYAADILQLLPAQFKGCLLAIARRKELLNDRALGALADAEHACLDCHGTGVSEAALQQALAASPQLQQLDLRGCPVGPSTLRLLGLSCPRLEVLRIGGHEAIDGNSGCAGALKKLLPRVEKAEHADIESWECLADQEQGEEVGAAKGRLMRLRCLVWPRIPSELRKYCRGECPLLLVNPSSDEVAQQSLPPEYNPAEPLDARLFTGFGNSSRWERQEGDSEAPVVHIAERFRQAYVEQAQQRRERAERADRRWAQQRRREIRQSPAEVAIRRWLNEA